MTNALGSARRTWTKDSLRNGDSVAAGDTRVLGGSTVGAYTYNQRIVDSFNKL